MFKSGLDISAVRQFDMVIVAIAAIVMLIGFIVLNALLVKYRIELPYKRKGIRDSLSNIFLLRRRDKFIITCNKIISYITAIVQNSIFKLDDRIRDYYDYNIRRAGIKAPGGYRDLTAEEFNALIKVAVFILLVAFILIWIFVDSIIGFFGILVVILVGSGFPMLIVRRRVAEKDNAIRRNFIDLYLMMHYNLVAGSGVPLEKILKSYSKTTRSKAMGEFVDDCIRYIDIYGEYNALQYIIKDYREVPEVIKLMRLIKQYYDGGNVNQDLMGFREELIKNKKYEIEKYMNRLVEVAKISFGFLMIILGQAIVSAWAIYFKDLSSGLEMFFK